MKRVVLIIAFVALVVIGALFIFTKKGSTPSTQDSNINASQSANPGSSSTSIADITYNDDGFTPTKLIVKVGDVIAIKNQSKIALQLASDPHPVHTANKDLNQQSIPAGGSLAFTVTKKGTFGYHNHNNTGHTGSIVVE